MIGDNADAVQVAPLNVFPIQQIIFRYQINTAGNIRFQPKYVYLGDALLKPEPFAAGSLLYLRSMLPLKEDAIYPERQLFSFSSAPASLAADVRIAAEVSPILAESFAVPIMPLSRTGEVNWAAECWPRVRDLVPGGWTVIVSQEMHKEVERFKHHGPNCTHWKNFQFIRYAFVRVCRQRILVDQPPLTPPGPEELEVVGLKEFLGATAPEVDPAVVDRHLRDVAEELAALWCQAPRPPGRETVSMLPQADAADLLVDFLEDARKVKKRLCVAMKGKPRKRVPS